METFKNIRAIRASQATPFNRHYEFAVVECQDRSLSSPTGPKFRTWQLVGTDRKRETVYG